ncbi:hypothetical protein NLI96_g8056 [Meripilus lineatus]|uniref:Uncharacterized protein n=1 Tax=Meripilus lineatus TaxID=2056292 RepID=A0AAD5YEA8_9APHY|nr:hypothetical protein NLI96_g8056 [Physisporinus lineatus]
MTSRRRTGHELSYQLNDNWLDGRIFECRFQVNSVGCRGAKYGITEVRIGPLPMGGVVRAAPSMGPNVSGRPEIGSSHGGKSNSGLRHHRRDVSTSSSRDMSSSSISETSRHSTLKPPSSSDLRFLIRFPERPRRSPSTSFSPFDKARMNITRSKPPGLGYGIYLWDPQLSSGSTSVDNKEPTSAPKSDRTAEVRKSRRREENTVQAVPRRKDSPNIGDRSRLSSSGSLDLLNKPNGDSDSIRLVHDSGPAALRIGRMLRSVLGKRKDHDEGDALSERFDRRPFRRGSDSSGAIASFVEGSEEQSARSNIQVGPSVEKATVATAGPSRGANNFSKGSMQPPTQPPTQPPMQPPTQPPVQPLTQPQLQPPMQSSSQRPTRPSTQPLTDNSLNKNSIVAAIQGAVSESLLRQNNPEKASTPLPTVNFFDKNPSSLPTTERATTSRLPEEASGVQRDEAMTVSSTPSSTTNSLSEVSFPLEAWTRGMNLERLSEANMWWLCMSSAQVLTVRRAADSRDSELELRLTKDFVIEIPHHPWDPNFGATMTIWGPRELCTISST